MAVITSTDTDFFNHHLAGSMAGAPPRELDFEWDIYGVLKGGLNAYGCGGGVEGQSGDGLPPSPSSLWPPFVYIRDPLLLCERSQTTIKPPILTLQYVYDTMNLQYLYM